MGRSILGVKILLIRKCAVGGGATARKTVKRNLNLITYKVMSTLELVSMLPAAISLSSLYLDTYTHATGFRQPWNMTGMSYGTRSRNSLACLRLQRDLDH